MLSLTASNCCMQRACKILRMPTLIINWEVEIWGETLLDQQLETLQVTLVITLEVTPGVTHHATCQV